MIEIITIIKNDLKIFLFFIIQIIMKINIKTKKWLIRLIIFIRRINITKKTNSTKIMQVLKKF